MRSPPPAFRRSSFPPPNTSQTGLSHDCLLGRQSIPLGALDQPEQFGPTAPFPAIPGITGMVREEFIAEATGLLGDSNIQELSEERFVGTLVYPVADPDGATLTVRQREGDPRVTPAGLAWRLVDDRHVEITRPSEPGFDRGAIHEFIYRARDPIVMGIGFAAIRDIVSFLRY